MVLFSAVTHLFYVSHLKLAYSMAGLRGIGLSVQQAGGAATTAAATAATTAAAAAATATAAATTAAAGTTVANANATNGTGTSGVAGVGPGSGVATAAPAAAGVPPSEVSVAPTTPVTLMGVLKNGRMSRTTGGAAPMNRARPSGTAGAGAAVADLSAIQPQPQQAPAPLLRMGTFNMNGGGSLSPPAANRSRSLFFRGLSGDTEARIFKLYMFVHVLTTGCAMMLLAALPHVQHDPERFDALCTAAFVAIAVLLLNFALCQLLRFFFLLRCTRNECSAWFGMFWNLRAL
jgi:hypothetical protein